MKRFFSGEIIFNGILTPTVSPSFQNAKMAGRTRLFLPQIPFFGIWREIPFLDLKHPKHPF